MYEVNANGNRTYRSTSAKSVASVAADWAKQGHEPKAFAIREIDGMVTCREVVISGVRATTQSLAAA